MNRETNMKVRSMRGELIDLTQMMAQNERTVAIGNAKMNARGDELGHGGKVIKRREQVAQDYHNANPKSVRKVSLKDVEPDTYLSPAEAVKQAIALADAIRNGEAQPTPAPENNGLMTGPQESKKGGRRVVSDPDLE